MVSTFIYPGGKSRFAERISKIFLEMNEESKCRGFGDPFCGAASIPLYLIIKNLFNGTIYLNDVDKSVIAVLQAYKNSPLEITNEINKQEVSVSYFRKYKENLADSWFIENSTFIDVALRKICVQQWSHGGLGVLGGVRGGYHQVEINNNLGIGSRWNVGYLKQKIFKIHKILNQLTTKMSSVDYKILPWLYDESIFLYLDPPYFQSGSKTYQYHFECKDHWKLMEILKMRKNWLLSYDNSPEIYDMYGGWCHIQRISSKQNIHHTNKFELLISPN